MKHRLFKKKQNDNKAASLGEAHDFWRNPDKINAPETYLAPDARSQHLLEKVRQYTTGEPGILEIGCNIGRNLNGLYQGGFRNLHAIEINSNAVRLLRETFPDMAGVAKIHNAPVEEVVRTLGDGSFDLIYSMAVLEHIHTDSDWIFAEIARASKQTVLTMEDEGGRSPLHFPRNYRQVFEGLGLRQVEEEVVNHLFDVTPEVAKECGGHFVLRVFQKS